MEAETASTDRPWREALSRLVADRPVICVGGPPAIWRREIEEVRACGATGVVVLTLGATQPGLPDVEVVSVDLAIADGADLLTRLHAEVDAATAPHPELVDAVRRLDPEGRAICFGTFLNEASHIDGRAFLAHRRPEWVALEDKTVVDAFWDRCGVTHAPSEVVSLADAPAAHDRVAGRYGSVWSADAREGWHGGATRLAWVRTADDVEAATATLAPWCDRVRVMPFLAGVPCSVHGVVCGDGTAALRPVEMMSFVAGDRFRYAGCGTHWDPPPAVRDAMRDVARRVGECLRSEVAFRGAFTVDGVVTGDGFVPTELNPRSGAGLAAMGVAIDDIPLLLVIELIKGGHDVGWSAGELEQLLLSSADEHRSSGTWTGLPGASAGHDDTPLGFVDGTWRLGVHADDADALLTTSDGYVRCRMVSERWPTGPSMAPAAIAFYDFCDRELGTSMGPLSTPLPEVLDELLDQLGAGNGH